MPFTGRAIHTSDSQGSVFRGVAEDVSDIIGMISPYETPLLDRLGDAPRAARNVLHEWLEDALNPNTLASSTTAASNGTAIAVHVSGNQVAQYLQAGAVLKNNTTGEYVQVASSSGNTITITRGFGGTTAATITAGDTLFFISDAALEGADVSVDISRPRTRQLNYTQIFKKDVIISGTVEAVTQLGGVTDEMEYQKQQRMREALRDLEKAVIQGKLSGNSIGTASAYRTMRGIWDFLSTNAYSVATLTESWLNTAIQAAWNNGGTDLNLIIADANWKRVIDSWNSSRIQVFQGDGTANTYHQRVTYYEGTFGVQEVILGRWMPSYSLMILSTERCKAVPLQGRSFNFQPVSKTGDAEKGMIIGEYTTEVWNQEGMAKVYGTS